MKHKKKILSQFFWLRLWYRIKIKTHKTLIKIKIPLCRGFEHPCFKIGKRRQQNTAYANSERNFVFACESCLKEINGYWNERWQEYYDMCR